MFQIKKFWRPNQEVVTAETGSFIFSTCREPEKLARHRMKQKCQIPDCDKNAFILCDSTHRAWFGFGKETSYRGCNKRICEEHIIIDYNYQGKIVSHRCFDSFFSACNFRYYYHTHYWIKMLAFIAIIFAAGFLIFADEKYYIMQKQQFSDCFNKNLEVYRKRIPIQDSKKFLE